MADRYIDCNTMGIKNGKLTPCFEMDCGECELDPAEHCHEELRRRLPEFQAVAVSPENPVPDQSAKADNGKPKLSLAPIEQLWRAIAEVREYGCKKYHDPENWKRVELNRYYDAFYRHIAATLTDRHSVDSESGIEHIKHAACNLAFILELEAAEREKPEKEFRSWD